MGLLYKDRFRNFLTAVFLIAFGLTCISPPYLTDFLLQHILTVIAIFAIWYSDRFIHFSRFAFFCLLVFLFLHILGARYLYSNVPYDEWWKTLFGFSIQELYGFQRNHYDRLVHFMYGLLMFFPAREMFDRFWKVKKPWSYPLAVETIMATSAVYELMEWGVAVVLSPETAEAYNGQQGDIWDSQKDMLMALSGAVLAMTTAFIWNRLEDTKTQIKPSSKARLHGRRDLE